MMATEMAPKNKLKIKFGSQRIEDVPGVRFSLANATGCSKNGSLLACGNKQGPLEVLEGQRNKRQKMDRGMTQQCSATLRTLMYHKHGWIFNQPVDPVALKIPDYFSIISEPMDLGTIKSKLQKNLYTVTEQFATDIRLTFSNAMYYNPPGNDVHTMAKALRDIFEMKWKSLERRIRGDERLKAIPEKIHTVRTVEVSNTKQNCPRTPPLRVSVLPKKPKVRAFDVQPVEVSKKCLQSISGKTSCKGADSNGRGSVSAKPVSSLNSNKCATCCSNTCHCSLPCDSTHASSVTSDRSLGKDHSSSVEMSRLDCQSKSTLSSQRSKSDQESDGTVSTLVNGNSCPSSRLSASVYSASGEGCSAPIFDVQMSPKKALRAAMLKSRFADTILKAQHKTLLDHGDITDPVKLQQQKEKLERTQREERARTEAQIRAAEAAARLKEETELRKQREKEREAARIALQKMERTVELDENLVIFKQLELLSGCRLDRLQVGNVKNPLTQLGLFIKDDYLLNEDEDEDEDAGLNTEEGEIVL
jgi:hypothetical protein